MHRPTLRIISLLALFLVSLLPAAFAESRFSALPVEYTGSELHFLLELDCGTTLCKSDSKYYMQLPLVDCSREFTADISWYSKDMNTLIKTRVLTPFTFIIPSPFSNTINHDNATVKAYIRVIKDVKCPRDGRQSAETGEGDFIINDTIHLPAKQSIATPPFQEVQQQFDAKMSRAVMKIFPPSATPSMSPKIVISIDQFPISDFNSMETVEIVPGGLWQLSPNAPKQLKCIFFFEDEKRDYVFPRWELTTTGGNYHSYTIKISDHHVPNIAAPVFIDCVAEETAGGYIPDVLMENNSLFLRYYSSLLDPTFEIQSFVAKTSDPATPKLQIVNLKDQVGPYNAKQVPYFYPEDALHPIISRYVQGENFDEKNPIYDSYYSFEYPIKVPEGLFTDIERIKAVFPSIGDKNLKFKIAVQEFAVIDDVKKPIPTIEEVQKQIKQAQFSISCAASGKKLSYRHEIVYTGNFTVTDVTVVNYLSDTSLPQYPLITFTPQSQEQVDFRKYDHCESYSLNVFLQLTSSNLPKLASQRNKGIFILENDTPYGESTLDPSGGVMTDTTMSSLTSVGATGARQRYIFSNTNNVQFNIDHSPINKDRMIQLNTISFIPPQGNGDGEPETNFDSTFSLSLMSPHYFFTSEDSFPFPHIIISCDIHPVINNTTSVTVLVEPHELLFDPVVLRKMPKGEVVKITCQSKIRKLFLKQAVQVTKSSSAAVKSIPTRVTMLLHQESVVTAPVVFDFTDAMDGKKGHFLRNFVIVLFIIAIIGVLGYFAFKFFQKREKSDDKQVQLDTRELLDDGSGYDNLQ